MKKIDVSVVLNMHREALYLRPTLRSLEACAKEAAKASISVELVAVFDRSDSDTLEVFRTTPLSQFARIKTTEIDAGSLGLARNAGIDLAEGDYIWTADGDDMASKNCIVELFNTAKSASSSKVAVFVDFLVAFGAHYHVVRYFDTSWLTPADFAYQHPYISRIFISRLAFREIRYQDLKVTAGFAYEDWDLNCRLMAAGYEFIIAPDTIFFYRQRANSLLKQANAASARTIPHNELFEPAKFVQLMQASRTLHSDWQSFINKRRTLHERSFAKELLQSDKNRTYISDAVLLDPEVDPRFIESTSSYCPIPWDGNHWGNNLDSLYKMAGNEKFSDVVLLPWLKPGGAEKYILQILEKIKIHDPSCKILVISGQHATAHEWICKLPSNSVFIDIFNGFPALDEAGRLALTMRAILSLARKGARLHLKTSEFSHRFMENFGAALSNQMQIVYYRFCEDSYEWNGTLFSSSFGTKHLRQILPSLSMLVSDCHHIVKKDELILGRSTKPHVVYAECSTTPNKPLGNTPNYRLLWSSRICKQKRPDILISTAKKLEKLLPNLRIDVYGSFEHPYTSDYLKIGNICYQGTYASFDQIDASKYDGLLYTTAFDGLPNIILEALGSGLPAIAPDIGGIPEAVISGATGFLLEDKVNTEMLVDSYVKGVLQIYTNWAEWRRMSNEAKNLIHSRHNRDTHTANVARVFAITAAQ